MAAAAAIPTAKDLRKPWWKIGDQGTSGSCVGWATAEGLLRWHFVTVNRLAETIRLSPRFIWMAAKETDEFNQRPTTFIETDGTSLKAALDIARKYGAVEEKELPFASGALFPGQADVFYIIASQLRVQNYINLGRDVRHWREWLAQKGPVLVRLDVDAAFENATATQGQLDSYQHPGYPKGHAVALVGYTAERFIVRNSWGTSWGDRGFAYAADAYAIAAFTEAYGVSV